MKAMNGPHKYVFTDFEKAFIKAHYQRLNNSQMAMMLGHKLTLLRMQLYKMGLKRMELEYWTEEQVKLLREMYQEYGDTEIAEVFETKWKKDKGWSKKHIEKKRKYLKLLRTDEEQKRIKDRNTKMGRFAECSTKMWETRGVAPALELRIWTTGDGNSYWVIKVKEGWVHYAPWLWRQIYGEPAEGMMVSTKDGDRMNCTLSNLVLLTRAENGTKNSKNRLPAEWREVKRLNNELNKAIYEHRKKNTAAIE